MTAKIAILLAASFILGNVGAKEVAAPLFDETPGGPQAPDPDFDPAAFATRTEYPVEINLRNVADAASLIEVTLPDRVVTFRQHRFTPIAGYYVTDDFEIRLDPDTPDERIRFDMLVAGEAPPRDLVAGRPGRTGRNRLQCAYGACPSRFPVRRIVEALRDRRSAACDCCLRHGPVGQGSRRDPPADRIA